MAMIIKEAGKPETTFTPTLADYPIKKWKFVPSNDIERVESILFDIPNMTLEDHMNLNVLGNDMIKYAIENKGVGLAAPQIGIFHQIFVFQKSNQQWEICVNPWFTVKNTPEVTYVEGCLSYPGKDYMVTRYKRINAIYYGFDRNHTLVRRNKELRGSEAIIFQHEMGHLNGRTIAMIGKEVVSKNITTGVK